ncbi:MAG: hypothetical protein KKE73_08225 [Proteobacteria bacterium]|nr:hypothetical protein [Pseudomonadota bacterium]
MSLEQFKAILRTIESSEDLMQFVVKYAPNGRRAREIAAAIGKDHQVLLNEANPANDSHKFGVQLVHPVCCQAGAMKLLAMFHARAAGMHAVDMDSARVRLAHREPGQVMDAVLDSMVALGHVADTVREKLGDGQLTRAEAKAISHATWELIEDLLILDAAASTAAGQDPWGAPSQTGALP